MPRIGAVDIDAPTPLLGGQAPAAFMRRHWQRKPLLVRNALVDAMPGFGPRDLFALAALDGVESRLVRQADDRWSLTHGPIARRRLPPLAAPRWTLLVQGVDLHDGRARALLERFRFIADARLDDVMVSYASDGGGVGPHVDSYDVFLLQLAGRRRWSIARPRHRRSRDDVPLRMLEPFDAEASWSLAPGDMLYLPPGWAHDGVAEGPCLTASIGFRAPTLASLGAALLQRIGDAVASGAENGDALRYADRDAAASTTPARIPPPLARHARAAVRRLASDPALRDRALGEWLSEPKANVWFDRANASSALARASSVVLDRRTRMLYDARRVFVNGESHAVAGADGRLLRRLADRRTLDAADVAALGDGARAWLDEWRLAGWVHDDNAEDA